MGCQRGIYAAWGFDLVGDEEREEVTMQTRAMGVDGAQPVCA